MENEAFCCYYEFTQVVGTITVGPPASRLSYLGGGGDNFRIKDLIFHLLGLF